MSDRSGLILYTDPALKDLEGISAYGIEQWGGAKALDYLSHLYAVIETLAEHPALGVECIGLHAGTRRLASAARRVLPANRTTHSGATRRSLPNGRAAIALGVVVWRRTRLIDDLERGYGNQHST